MKKETGQTVRELAYFASLGISVALAIVIGLAAGFWLDRLFDTKPVLLLVGLAFGIAAGFSNIIRAGKKVVSINAGSSKNCKFCNQNQLAVTAGGWFAGLMMTPIKFALGIILGGLIVAINFHLLENTLKKMLTADVVLKRGRSVVSNVLVKYYLRFIITGALITLLISQHIVHPLGLLIGLSVVVASIFLATALELKRIFFKEAV